MLNSAGIIGVVGFGAAKDGGNKRVDCIGMFRESGGSSGEIANSILSSDFVEDRGDAGVVVLMSVRVGFAKILHA